MGKKKSNKKKEEKVVIKNMESDDSIKKKLLIVSIVIVCIGVFYFLAVYLTNNDTSSVENNDKDVEAVIDYEKIVIGEVFNKKGEYYVAFYNASDESINSAMTSLISPYRAEEGTLAVYEVDMSSVFNKDYVTIGDVNKSPANLDELRINGPTLIKFKDGVVVEYLTSTEDIENALAVEDEEEHDHEEGE